MAASVRIEDEAFSDIRYDVLANACGLADGDHARGKMARIWRQCTAQKAYVLPVSVVVSVLGQNAVSGLVEAELGEVVDGGIRIRGTKGRIEWLSRLRKNATKGGKAKSAKRQASGSPDGSQKPAKSLPPPCPPAPAPAPVQISEREPDRETAAVAAPLTLVTDRPRPERPRRTPAPKSDLPESWIPSESEANRDAERDARQRGVSIELELAKMRDWSKSGGSPCRDWDARWRNWLRAARPQIAQPGSLAQVWNQGIRKTTPL